MKRKGGGAGCSKCGSINKGPSPHPSLNPTEEQKGMERELARLVGLGHYTTQEHVRSSFVDAVKAMGYFNKPGFKRLEEIGLIRHYDSDSNNSPILYSEYGSPPYIEYDFSYISPTSPWKTGKEYTEALKKEKDQPKKTAMTILQTKDNITAADYEKVIRVFPGMENILLRKLEYLIHETVIDEGAYNLLTKKGMLTGTYNKELANPGGLPGDDRIAYRKISGGDKSKTRHRKGKRPFASRKKSRRG